MFDARPVGGPEQCTDPTPNIATVADLLRGDYKLPALPECRVPHVQVFSLGVLFLAEQGGDDGDKQHEAYSDQLNDR